ncbi:MAG TPA: FHA domain-containing protein [Phenylobacterium sp.]|jgi:hypothetical protein
MAKFDDETTKPYRAPAAKNDDPDKTRVAGPGGYYDDEEDEDGGDDVTRAAVPGGARAPGAPAPKAGRIVIEKGDGSRGPRITFPADTASQPVCAVMLIVKGPGLGMCLPLSYGRSSVGRGADARLQLNIGDDQLSGMHFIVAFDETDGSFDVREADAATNHTYVNGARVRAATVLAAGDVIRAGGTEFRFVPCCGPDWSWTQVLTGAG